MIVERWQTRGGKYWYELLQHSDGTYTIRHTAGVSSCGNMPLEDAQRKMHRSITLARVIDGHNMKQVV